MQPRPRALSAFNLAGQAKKTLDISEYFAVGNMMKAFVPLET